jgi:hypothetical protein
MRAALAVALQEQTAEAMARAAAATEQLAGAHTGFDLGGYHEFLKKKCSALQLAVMHTSTYQYDRKITLWSVFVPQVAREAAPVPEIPREVQRRLREEGHLGQELDERQMEEFRQRYQASAISPILEILERTRLAVVLGNPGSGKSSLLKYLALRWVNDDRGPLPLFVDLREYVKEHIGLPEYFAKGCANHRLDIRELDKRLQAGEAALFLDGLDEIFDASIRGLVVSEIVALSSRYPQAKIVVTSRTFGYEPEKLQNAGFLHATLEDFDDLQRKEFLRLWHKVAEDDPRERERLRSRIERAIADSTAITELAGNPLLLTMMAILNRNQELPRDRVELYREASRVLLGEWDASRALPVDEFARQEKEALLRELAGDMQQGEGGLAGNLIERSRLIQVFKSFLSGLGIQDSYSKSQQLVDQLTKRNFILAFAGADRFSFVHRTFLEYYCAAWFVERFEKKQELSLERLRDEVFGGHWQDESWHEVLRLIAGMLDEKKAEQLIRFLMQLDGRNNKMANLMLAAGCLSEVRNRRAVQATDQELWERFIAEVVHYDPPYYCEPWEQDQEIAPVRQAGVTRIASTWRLDKAQAWLRTAAISDRDFSIRRAAVQELARGWKDDPETLPFLKGLAVSDANYSLQEAVIQELSRGWRDDPEILLLLKNLALSGFWTGRRAAVRELARGWSDDPETLPLLKQSARSDPDNDVQETAVEELARGWEQDPEVLLLLKDLVSTAQYSNVQSAARKELMRRSNDDPEIRRKVKALVRSSDREEVRYAALQELATNCKDDPETLTLLKEYACSDPDTMIRSMALQELSRSWRDDPEVRLILEDRARSDQESMVRFDALHEIALNWGNEPEILSFLKERAHLDKDSIVQQVAIQEVARGWKHNLETQLWLKNCVCNAGHSETRAAALRELANGWKNDPETLLMLKDRARSDKDNEVRQTAVHELVRGWNNDPETLPLLKNLVRSDQAGPARQAALQELARGWKTDPETLFLLQSHARSDEDAPVRQAAIQELARGWENDPATLLIIKDRISCDTIPNVHHVALAALPPGWSNDLDMLRLVTERARSAKNWNARYTAIRKLIEDRPNDPEVVALAKQRAREDTDPNARRVLLNLLAHRWKDDPEVIAMLKEQQQSAASS